MKLNFQLIYACSDFRLHFLPLCEAFRRSDVFFGGFFIHAWRPVPAVRPVYEPRTGGGSTGSPPLLIGLRCTMFTATPDGTPGGGGHREPTRRIVTDL